MGLLPVMTSTGREVLADFQRNKLMTCAAWMAVALQPDNHLVLTEDLPIDPAIDEWHWNGNGEFSLGVRFGEKLLSVTT